MALDFVALQTEVYARGFDYLNDGGAGVTRVKRWINDAMHQVDDLEPWLYLQASTTGTAPLTISDLGRIESVVDVANLNPLTFVDRRDVTDYYGNIAQTSSVPSMYFVTGGTVVATYPVSTVTLTVRYSKVAADLSANGDTPAMPDRFRMAIVEYAAAQAYRDVSDWDGASQATAAGDAIVRRMVEWNTLAQGMGTNQRITGASEDW
jgi:hypothetical protein